MDPETYHHRLGHPWLLGLTAALLLFFKLAVADQMETPFRYSRLHHNDTLPGIAYPLNQPYADGLTLIGYDRSAAQIPADGTLRIDLHWTVRQQPSRRYQTAIHLVGSEGLRWSHPDSYRPTDYEGAPSTSAWTPGRHALDSHEVELLPGTPPGTYDVVLTVFDRDTLVPLSALNEQLQPTAPELTLGQVTLVAPQSPPRVQELGIQERLGASLGPLTLLGVNFDRQEAAAGDPVFATTFWRVDERPLEKLVLRLELIAPDGSVAVAYDLPPTTSWHPTFAWQPGDVWRGQHLLHLPADLDTATYAWALRLLPATRRTVSLNEFSVTAPARSFVPPPMDLRVDAPLGDVATLVGASVVPDSSAVAPGTTLTVTLAWRAEAETNIGYRVFVHLLGPDGELVAQSDGVPADWSRPTTGWVPEEYVIDRHLLTVPDDASSGTDYELITGMYVSPGGERLTTPDGQAAISLTTLTAEEE